MSAQSGSGYGQNPPGPGGQSGPPPYQPAGTPEEPQKSRTWLYWTAAIVAALAVGVGGYFLGVSQGKKDYDPGFTDLEPSCGGCEAPCVPGVGSHPFCRKCWRKIPREARREMIALRRAWDATRGDDPEGDGAPLRIAWAKAARALRGHAVPGAPGPR